MAKLSIQRLLDTAKLLATESGQQLQDLITFTNDLADQVLRALRQGLTFQDNVNCLVSSVSLKHNVHTIVNTNGKRPYGVIPVRIVSDTVKILGFNWHIDTKDQLNVNISLDETSESYSVVLIILFS